MCTIKNISYHKKTCKKFDSLTNKNEQNGKNINFFKNASFVTNLNYVKKNDANFQDNECSLLK